MVAINRLKFWQQKTAEAPPQVAVQPEALPTEALPQEIADAIAGWRDCFPPLMQHCLDRMAATGNMDALLALTQAFEQCCKLASEVSDAISANAGESGG